LELDGADSIPSKHGVDHGRRVAYHLKPFAVLPIVPTLVDLVVVIVSETPIFTIVPPTKLEILQEVWAERHVVRGW
jgi:hypothetical protein